MIWPILEARAEIEKYFLSFFGSNENFKICFRNQLTFSAYLKKDVIAFEISLLEIGDKADI